MKTERSIFTEKMERANESRVFLHVYGFLSEKENVAVKKRIDREMKKMGYVRKSRLFIR